jgi:hypothetical protein
VRSRFVLVVALVFIGVLGGLTVIGFAQDGVTGLNIVSVLILVLFSIGIVGSLLQRPRR